MMMQQSLTLEEQLFVAENLAYFPYQVQQEPLLIVEQIGLTVSVSDSTQLQQFRDLLKQHLDYIDDDEGRSQHQHFVNHSLFTFLYTKYIQTRQDSLRFHLINPSHCAQSPKYQKYVCMYV